ncbi:hypothetical protein [Lactobacillus crispatus]|uniref:CopG family transcriptional regulator n=1 Tax=Lactobacillus crispatus TaxID=47770 RepID=A0AAW6XHR7_9LACO|nr:hypothetical protein [Lactobacillus crispatus]MDK6503154.1 hypothetical protein [Lactobacillus crispatus]PLA29675.1 hypothetical protein CYJ80_08140 [Lactobacillus crispatus]
MSFNLNQGKKFAAALKESKPNEQDSNVQDSTEENSNYIKREKRKPYTFSLMPSARIKLTESAKEHGYNSSSNYLNDAILNGKL